MNTEKPCNSFLPDFCDVRAVFVVVVSAELLAMVLALAVGNGIDQFWYELSIRSLYVQWITLLSAGMICLLRRYIGDKSHVIVGLLAWLLIMLVALLVVEAAVWLIPKQIFDADAHADLLLETLGISAIVGALILRYLYENYQQKQRELAESRARFQALQARIHPHFLFNSINTIISLIQVDPKQAQNTLYDLADLFRASLGDESRASTLADEIQLMRQYLEIERQRLGDRLQLDWRLAELPDSLPMPPLILQPLAENAVYHGIEPAVKGGSITLNGHFENGVVTLMLSNTLPPDNSRCNRKSHHMALENVRQRLLVKFGETAGISTRIVDNDYQVAIWFPAPANTPA